MMKTAYAATAAALILAGCGGGSGNGSGGHSDAYNQGYNWAVSHQNSDAAMAGINGADPTCHQFVPAGLDQGQWIKGCTDELNKLLAPASDQSGAPGSQP